MNCMVFSIILLVGKFVLGDGHLLFTTETVVTHLVHTPYNMHWLGKTTKFEKFTLFGREDKESNCTQK